MGQERKNEQCRAIQLYQGGDEFGEGKLENRLNVLYCGKWYHLPHNTVKVFFGNMDQYEKYAKSERIQSENAIEFIEGLHELFVQNGLMH